MMEIRLEVISKAELSELREEALEVPFLWHGVPLIFSMARGKTIDIVFGSDEAAEPVPPHIILAGAMSAFRERVYKALMNVPRGTTVSYSQLAALAGHPTAVRAVATAVARNPFACLVPCHRVVPANGSTGRYRWGEKLKAALLELEKQP